MPISFLYYPAFDTTPLGWERPFRPIPACHRSAILLRPLHRSASGTAGAPCSKSIEACCTQDCRLSQRPEEVLNVRNAPAKPLCKGPRTSFFPLQCLPRRSNALCHNVHFRQWQVLCYSASPASQNKKRPDKSRVRPEGHTLPVYLYLTICAETGAKRPQNAETTR